MQKNKEKCTSCNIILHKKNLVLCNGCLNLKCEKCQTNCYSCKIENCYSCLIQNQDNKHYCVSCFHEHNNKCEICHTETAVTYNDDAEFLCEECMEEWAWHINSLHESY